VTGARVLIAEDERHLGMLLEHFLVGRGHDVTLVADGRTALQRLDGGAFDVALLDVQMPGMDGVAVLRAARDQALPPEVIVMTGNGTVDVAITAMQHGAYDYLAKPYRMAEVDLLVTRAVERRRLARERFASTLAGVDDAIALQSVHAPLLAVLDAVARAAPAMRAMLVHGEPGTGRGALARRAHAAAGAAPNDPFVAVDAAAVRGGGAPNVTVDAAVLLRLAAGGTLYVRRVEMLAPDAQRALLAALGDDPPRGVAPARILAATAVARDDLRILPALADRLDALRAELPALRDRAVDVPLLADAIVRRLGGDRPPAVSDAAAERLARHPWPGNVPELRVILERALARASAGVIAIEHLGLP